ncbi:GroES-like protein [Ostertagia ostertagi]
MVFNGPQQPMLAETRVLRELAPDEILVKNKYTTICGSDLHTYSGVRKEACPTVLGHEIVGTVEAIGGQHSGTDLSGQPLRIGDLVTWSVFSSNPCSPGARQGMPQKGADLFKYGHALIAGDDAFHGGLAEYCILRKGTAILRLPEELPLPVAATINCAIATTAGALRLAGSIAGKTVLVTGMGLLGLTAVAMCREAGALKIKVSFAAGAGGTVGNNRFDNFTLDASPLAVQALVHYWNFNSNTTVSSLLAPSHSVVTGAAITAVAGGISAIDAAGGTGQNFNVSNLNARNGDLPGTHLRFNDPIGGALVFSLPTTGYKDVTVKFTTRRSGSGAGLQYWSYTTDGTTYVPYDTIRPIDGDPVLQTLDLTAITAANNNANLKLRPGQPGSERSHRYSPDHYI